MFIENIFYFLAPLFLVLIFLGMLFNYPKTEGWSELAEKYRAKPYEGPKKGWQWCKLNGWVYKMDSNR